MGAMKRLQTLSDEDLVARLESLCRVEPLYSYCVERLGLSSDVAYKRMQAAEVAQA